MQQNKTFKIRLASSPNYDCRIPAARRFARSVFNCVTASSVPVASATAAAGVGAGPVGPIGPSAPTGPVAPVAPAGPVGPVAPAGPVEPCIYAQH